MNHVTLIYVLLFTFLGRTHQLLTVPQISSPLVSCGLLNGDAELGQLTGWNVLPSSSPISASSSQNQFTGTVYPAQGNYFIDFGTGPTVNPEIAVYQQLSVGSSQVVTVSGLVQSQWWCTDLPNNITDPLTVSSTCLSTTLTDYNYGLVYVQFYSDSTTIIGSPCVSAPLGNKVLGTTNGVGPTANPSAWASFSLTCAVPSTAIYATVFISGIRVQGNVVTVYYDNITVSCQNLTCSGTTLGPNDSKRAPTLVPSSSGIVMGPEGPTLTLILDSEIITNRNMELTSNQTNGTSFTFYRGNSRCRPEWTSRQIVDGNKCTIRYTGTIGWITALANCGFSLGLYSPTIRQVSGVLNVSFTDILTSERTTSQTFFNTTRTTLVQFRFLFLFDTQVWIAYDSSSAVSTNPRVQAQFLQGQVEDSTEKEFLLRTRSLVKNTRSLSGPLTITSEPKQISGFPAPVHQTAPASIVAVDNGTCQSSSPTGSCDQLWNLKVTPGVGVCQLLATGYSVDFSTQCTPGSTCDPDTTLDLTLSTNSFCGTIRPDGYNFEAKLHLPDISSCIIPAIVSFTDTSSEIYIQDMSVEYLSVFTSSNASTSPYLFASASTQKQNLPNILVIDSQSIHPNVLTSVEFDLSNQVLSFNIQPSPCDRSYVWFGVRVKMLSSDGFTYNVDLTGGPIEISHLETDSSGAILDRLFCMVVGFVVLVVLLI